MNIVQTAVIEEVDEDHDIKEIAVSIFTGENER